MSDKPTPSVQQVIKNDNSHYTFFPLIDLYEIGKNEIFVSFLLILFVPPFC